MFDLTINREHTHTISVLFFLFLKLIFFFLKPLTHFLFGKSASARSSYCIISKSSHTSNRERERERVDNGDRTTDIYSLQFLFSSLVYPFPHCVSIYYDNFYAWYMLFSLSLLKKFSPRLNIYISSALSLSEIIIIRNRDESINYFFWGLLRVDFIQRNYII